MRNFFFYTAAFFLFTLLSITFERVVLQRLRNIHIVSMGQDHLFLEFEKNLSNQFRGLEFDPKHHTFEIPSRVSIMKYMINIIYFIIKKKTRTIINLLRETRNRKNILSYWSRGQYVNIDDKHVNYSACVKNKNTS